MSELKQEISRMFGVPAQQQRLFHGHIELSNSRSLEDYHIFDVEHSNRLIVVEFKQFSGSFIRKCPGPTVDKLISELIAEVNTGLAIKLSPNLTMDGTGGTYFVRNCYRIVRGIFKPLDEEAFAPNNPRGHFGKMGNPGFRPGVLSGEGGYREVAAYLLDHESFSEVPPTTLVEAQHESFCFKESHKQFPKKGSLQEFIKSQGCIEDFSHSMISKEEVQKIAILDMRILNMDRNEANILVKDNFHLVPIDHGLSIPDILDISEYDLCWMSWIHTKNPITPRCLDYILELDPVKDIRMLKDTMPFRDRCLRNMRISTTLLKKGAEAGLSLYNIGSMLYRQGYDDNPSIIEKILEKAFQIYKTVNQSLSSRLILENALSPKFPPRRFSGRPRAYSSSETIFESSRLSPKSQGSSQNTETDTSDNQYDVVLTISEITSSEEEDSDCDLSIPTKDASGRSLSLPRIGKFKSKLKLEKKKKIEESEAFNQRLFYYIEAFMDQAIAKKIKEHRRKYSKQNLRLLKAVIAQAATQSSRGKDPELIVIGVLIDLISYISLNVR